MSELYAYDNMIKLIDDMMPKEHFVACFGSSHTFGICKHDDNPILKTSDLWTTHLSNQIGMPVVNLAVVGADYKTQTEIVRDFFNLPSAKKCTALILESRLGVTVDRLPLDIIDPQDGYYRTQGMDYLMSNILQSRHFLVDDKSIAFKYPDAISLRELDRLYTYNKDKNISKQYICDAYIKNQYTRELIKHKKIFKETGVNPAWGIDIQVPEDYQQFAQSLADYLARKAQSIEIFRETYDQISIIKTMCKLSNTKFLWFTWGDNIPNSNEEVTVETKKVKKFKELYNTLSDIFESQIFNPVSLLDSYMTEFLKPAPKCECNHADASIQPWIANHVAISLKELYNKEKEIIK